MYPHQGGGGPGQYGSNGGEDMGPSGGDQGNNFHPNAAFADFMRSNDPNAGSSDGSGGVGSSGGFGGFGGGPPSAGAAGRSHHPGRGIGTTPSTRQSQGHSRRVTSQAARMPSQRSMAGEMAPTEPVVSDGAVSAAEAAAGIQGVAVGTMYETDSHTSGGGSRGVMSSSRYATSPSNAAFGAASHRMTPAATGPPSALQNSASAGSASDGFLPNAPYQEMMQTFGREDPTIERARMSMAGNRKQTELPLPQAGLPQEPTYQAMEPTMPSSRLGRRILTQKLERQPDFVNAKLAGHSSKAMPLDHTQVECVACRATVEIPKSAVVMACPSCDQVNPAASCRVVQMAVGAARAGRVS